MGTSLRSKWAVGKARGGRISQSIRKPRATQPPAHLQRNPPGRGQLAVFPRCSLGPYEFRYGRFARALRNSQLTCGDITIICETVHHHLNSGFSENRSFKLTVKLNLLDRLNRLPKLSI